MNVRRHHSLDELHTLYRSETNSRMARRLQAVWLAQQGRTCQQITDITGAARRTVFGWIAKYNRGGIDALLDRPKSGRPCRLTDAQQEQLKARVEAGLIGEDVVSVFNAAAIDNLVEKEFGVLYSLRGMQRLLGRLGFRYQCPQPRHENSDPEAQEAFQKGLLPCWNRLESSTPPSELTSTSRTKRDLGRRAR